MLVSMVVFGCWWCNIALQIVVLGCYKLTQRDLKLNIFFNYAPPECKIRETILVSKINASFFPRRQQRCEISSKTDQDIKASGLKLNPVRE